MGEEETKQRRAGPRSAPRPRRPTDPQPPRRRRRHRARRGEQWWPPPSPRSRPPPSTPRFSSSPSASYRRHQDTRVRLPHPARSERSSPPPAAREGGGSTASHRCVCQTRAGYLYPAGPHRPPSRPTCFGGCLDSRPPLIPQLLPNPPSQVKTLGSCPAPCSGLPHPTLQPRTGAGAPRRGQARGGGGAARAPAAPARFSQLAGTARTHPRHSQKPPRALAVTPSPALDSRPSPGTVPHSGSLTVTGGRGLEKLLALSTLHSAWDK